MHAEQRVARARLGRAAQVARATGRTEDIAAADDARRDYKALAAEAYIRRIVAEAPPLSTQQRDRLALLLRDGGDAA